jgi:hypothetical protein
MGVALFAIQDSVQDSTETFASLANCDAMQAQAASMFAGNRSATTAHKTDDAASPPLRSSSGGGSSSEVKGGRLLVNGRPSFRFGIFVYGLNASDWDTLNAAGYTTVLTYTNGCPNSPFDCAPNVTRAFLDNAAARNMKVILSLKDYYNYWNFEPSPKFEHEWRSTVSAFKSHQALLGWYLNDELGPSDFGFNASDLPAQTPWTKTIDMLTTRNSAVKAADPAHVTNSIVNRWICSACYASGAWPRIDFMGVYANISDIVGVDPCEWAFLGDSLSDTHCVHVAYLTGKRPSRCMEERHRLYELGSVAEGLSEPRDRGGLHRRTDAGVRTWCFYEAGDDVRFPNLRLRRHLTRRGVPVL